MDYLERRSLQANLRMYTEHIHLAKLLQKHPTPFLVFDAQKMREQYRRLQEALPGVQFYFALKAAGHAAAVRTIKACNGYLDVATVGEIALVKQEDFPLARCMHTHPIKKLSEIQEAYQAGLRRFVVENENELQKFAGLPEDIQLMVRLSYANPEAGSNLSYKFGATEHAAQALVRRAVEQGSTVAGFCMHVGSQIHSAEAYAVAIHETLRLMDEIEDTLGVQFTLLDIGGGFPVEYREGVPSLATIAATIRPLIAPLLDRLEILAEPGRFVAAPAGLLVTSVVGTNQRYGKPWYYIDDGLYGAYSIMIYDRMQPAIFAWKEVTTNISPDQLHDSVIAGPTCDSIDIVSSETLLPQLVTGDYLISPMMGAYTTVSATTFNGIPIPTIIPINEIKTPTDGGLQYSK